VIPVAPNVSYWDQFMASLAWWAASDARLAILSLLNSFGTATEPDFNAVAPVYSRMLAIALLLLGSVIAFGLIERIVGGAQGVGWDIVGRVMVAVFFAYSGLAVVEYVAGYAALLATAWTPDLAALSNVVGPPADPIGVYAASQSGHQVSVFGLVLTALFLTFMALVVYLELIIRSALILTVTVFVPLVCALSVWPRMASSAAHMGEFLVGLLLSKFVVATALYVGLHLVVPALVNGHPTSGHADWMESGVAVLLIVAFSPLVLFQALRFAHGTAGGLVRDWGAASTSLVPLSGAIRAGRGLVNHPTTQRAKSSIGSALRDGGQRLRRH
jgi:hypothetical protein